MKKCAMALAALLTLALPMLASADLPKVGGPMVPFVLDNDTGGKTDSKDLVGKSTLVISFLNTVCGTCNQELVDMQKMMKKHADKVTFLPVIVDARGMTTLKPYKEATGFSFTFLLDPNFAYGRKYGATFSPFTVVVNKEGNITGILRGYSEADAETLAGLLK